MSGEQDDLVTASIEMNTSALTSKEMDYNDDLMCNGSHLNNVEKTDVSLAETLNEKLYVSNEAVTARAWFESLSSVDRSAAVGFVDPAFLEAIRLSVPSRQVTNTTTSHELLSNEIMTVCDMKVPLDVFERNFLLINSNLLKTSSNPTNAELAKSEDHDTDVPLSSGERQSAKYVKGKYDGIAENDVSRVSPTPGDEEMTTINDKKENKSSLAGETFLKKSFAIFPKALSYVTRCENENQSPFVSFSFDDQNDCDSIDTNIKQLDDILTDDAGSPFLDFNALNKTNNNCEWLNRFGTTRSRFHVPIHTILLVRLEYEAFQSYTRWQSCQQSSVVVGRLGAEQQTYERINGQTLGDVFRHHKEMKTLIRDATTVLKCMEPFATCLEINESVSITPSMPDLICTPLSFILNSAILANGFNWHAINEALTQSLHLLTCEGGEPETPPISDTNMEKVQAAVNIDLSGKEFPDTSECSKLEVPHETAAFEDISKTSLSKTTKKKKKKNKRKKSRKSFNSPQEDQHIKDDASAEHDEDDSESVSRVDDVAEVTITPVPLPKTVSFDSVDSEVPEPEQIPSATFADEEIDKTDNITISRVDGSIIVYGSSLVSNAETSTAQPTMPENSVAEEVDYGDDWETVEARSKINKKKAPERPSFSNSKYAQQSSFNANGSNGSNKKQKYARQSAPKRKPILNVDRKRTKEVSSGAEVVDDEARNKQTIPSNAVTPSTSLTSSVIPPASRLIGNPWKNGPPGNTPVGNTAPQNAKHQPSKPAETSGKEKTLRDVLLGTHRTVPSLPIQPKPVTEVQKEKDALREYVAVAIKQKELTPTKSDMRGRGNQNQLNLSGDQNTAPTYQDTVSALSTASNIVLNSIEMVKVQTAVKSDISSADDEAPQNKVRQPVFETKKVIPSTPPLPILLSPENANSATSSVASSLEAPHVVYTPHHSKSVPRTNDVGYHLLDVCDRLSRDMDIFMSRRAIALEPRRQERGALLEALQDTVSSIWPNRCHAQLYGSCAIQLDLPSSDLDVVVVGLDRVETLHEIVTEENTSGMFQTTDISKPPPLNQYVHMPDMLNGERVMLLAGKLEKQAWAVQVKAIPTASVPVVKILADPSRLLGSSDVREWIPCDLNECAPSADNDAKIRSDDNSSTSAMYGSTIPFLPWRGNDVMKGLLALDITFEGYGHGGIGSTVFSSHIVDEACHQSSLQPDATPFVQVLMVLKELLAQRNLNEPYSGGLSSYALLLLLLALVRERDAIKEEIDRVENQKRAMTTADSESFCSPSVVAVAVPIVAEVQTSNTTTKSSQLSSMVRMGTMKVEQSVPQPTTTTKSNDKSTANKPTSASLTSVVDSAAAPKTGKSGSSWATIAKKASVSMPTSTSVVSISQLKSSVQNANAAKAKPSFADAVAKSVAPSTGSNKQATPVTINKKKVTPSKIELRTNSNAQPPIKNTAVIASTHETKESSITNIQVQTSTSNTDKGASKASAISLPAPYPQGVNDIIEVLCTGETTAGKLLMHFLLFYGQYFDAHTTAIDISGKHLRDTEYFLSPFLHRRAPGSIDPYTGMLIVDPIVVYDPLEGAEQNNVARRCFAWNSVRRLFLQSYETLSSAVERSATPPLSPSTSSKHVTVPPSAGGTGAGDFVGGSGSVSASTSEIIKKLPDLRVPPLLPTVAGVDINTGDPWDTKSPLLSCLLSF